MASHDKKVDFHTLKMPLLVFGIIVAVFATLLTTSFWFKSSHEITRNENLAHLQSLQLTEKKTRESGRIFKNYYGRYQELTSLGFIGNEKRLLWIEALRKSSAEQAPYGIDYKINQQRPFNGYLSVDQEQFGVQQSQMDIKLNLSHEGKLLAFLEALKAEKNGVFDTQECTLIPATNRHGIKPWQSNITAECRLNWYTLKPIIVETEVLL
jgi:hypothetical protein